MRYNLNVSGYTAYYFKGGIYFTMKAFMDKDFMLKNETAKHLFHDYAEALPIIDYHCHISPQEIYEDRRYDNIA